MCLWRILLSHLIRKRVSFGRGFSTRARCKSFYSSYLAFRVGRVVIDSRCKGRWGGRDSLPLEWLRHPTVEKGDDFRVNDLSQSQKWSVGFGPSGEVVVWEQGDEIWDGENRHSPYPLDILPPIMALNWELDSIEDEDTSLAILDAFEEDFLR